MELKANIVQRAIRHRQNTYLISQTQSEWWFHTAKKVIGNRLSRRKSPSLLMKKSLVKISKQYKCFPTRLMGKNPWYPMENSTPRLLGNADNLSENCDARVNISLSMVPLTFLVGRASEPFFKKLQWTGCYRATVNWAADPWRWRANVLVYFRQ